MNAVDEAKTPKTRHCTTRSRSGCVACREKHIRCDEKRPSCLNCAKKKLPCHYMPKIPLRERRTKARPGQQMVCLIPITQNPDLLQNTLLVSGIHYARNKGDLALFEPTFLFHKIQCIRQVNLWLGSEPDKNLQTKCARYISTLAITEACLGDFEAAESHLNGLVVYLDSKRLQTGQDARGPKMFFIARQVASGT
uniref:Zn(2)-C6 fungal-type domain-containing protein n=1 Tax=Fusarium oxysporum (strain Fo5176) TaxID=660025 RepID=A0A0D2XY58_FUSOF